MSRVYAILFILTFAITPCFGGILTQKDLDAGVEPKPGDEIILNDFSRLTPSSAISDKRTPGKWRVRPYKKPNGTTGGMLVTTERNLAKPETCICPPVTIPLALKGWYAVWVATYRGEYGGGIDVRLSRDDCFVHIDPQQVAFHAKQPQPRVGAIVEMNYKPAADLTGQKLVFQQPFGTFESFHWGFCEAQLAYVRLVKLRDAEVNAFQADQADNSRRVIAFDDDNFSRYWMWGGENANKIRRIFEPFRYHDIEFFGLCLGKTTNLCVPTPYSDVSINTGGRLGDKRMKTMYVDLAENGVDLVEVAVERAHKYGIKLLPTLRMSSGGTGKHYQSLSPYYLKTCSRFDFAAPQVQDHFVKMIRYILEKYDVDGFILDFTRHCVHFNPDEPDKAKLMNAFSAKMRKMVDEVSEKKGKKLLLAASISENWYVSSFSKHNLKIDVPVQDRLKVQGIDAKAWIENGYYDLILPEGPYIEKYVEMTKGTSTRCLPRWEYHSDMYGKAVASGIHDPTAKEDKKDRPINSHSGARDFEAGWLKLQEKGAKGLYMFNNPLGWVSLRRMGHLDEVRDRVKSGKVYGVIEGPIVEFTKP